MKTTQIPSPMPFPSPKNALAAAFNFLLPPLCPCCNGAVGENGGLCSECWKQINFINEPICAICGAPFDLPVAKGTLCAACIAEKPLFEKARSAVLYDEGSKKLILEFKHSDKIQAAPMMAEWMARAGADLWSDIDWIVPVPLHRWRLLARRYNQAALLAAQLGKLSCRPVAQNGIRRLRATQSQGHMNKKERHENLRGAFAVDQKWEQRLAGKNILIVDDVMTTGATISEAACALQKIGVCKVYALTFARVRKGD
jgi:ComF family protein